MPATTLAEIKNIAEAVERALCRVHETVGGAAVVPRSSGDNDDVFIVPNFSLGPATGHLYKRPDGKWDHDIFEDCLIEWELHVPRIGSWTHETFTATYTLFAQECTRIRLAMDPARWDALNAELPWHHLTRLVPAGTTQGFDSDRGEDRATVRFRCMVGIRPDAWPVAGAAYNLGG